MHPQSTLPSHPLDDWLRAAGSGALWPSDADDAPAGEWLGWAGVRLSDADEPSGSGPAPTPQKGIARSSALAGKRVVIVEDEGMTVWQLRRMLTNAGLIVVGSAPDGREGVEVVCRETPDLVLMDVTMPIMDGLEASRRILEAMRVCIVMVTAYDTFQEEAFGLGVSGYVVKPVTGSTLLPQLEDAYTRYGQQGSQGKS